MRGNGSAIANVEDYQPQRRFVLVRFDDCKLGRGRRYLVRGWIPREGLIVVWGPPKCGKSFWVFDLMMHVALGWAYRGSRVEIGSVVYIACEGEAGLAARKEAFQVGKLSEEPADPPFYLLATRLDLVADVDALTIDIGEQLTDQKCAAIVIDTLNRSLVGSESRDEDMAAYIKAADLIREKFHCAVIIIHHCGINDARPRGHTSLSGAVDAQIAIKRDASANVVATVEYMKDGPVEKITVSRLAPLDLALDEDGEMITSCVVEHVEGAPLSAPRKSRLTPTAGRAFQLLAEAVDKAGEIPPASIVNRAPPETRCISESLWRNYCYKGDITPTDTPTAKQKAFVRAAKELMGVGRVDKWENWVWML